MKFHYELTSSRRLGTHHLAYLRAVSEGVNQVEAGKRYLCIDHGHQLKTVHKQIRSVIKAVAKQKNLNTWRLVGLTIKPVIESRSLPTLEEFIEAQGLDGFSESEVIEFYQEHYPVDSNLSRRQKVRERLRKKQIELLKLIESEVVCIPNRSDPLDYWLDDLTVRLLRQDNHILLNDLIKTINVGGCWYRKIFGLGKLKAEQICDYLNVLIPGCIRKTAVSFYHPELAHQKNALIVNSTNYLTDKFTTDYQACRGWIFARAGSKETVKKYHQEVVRLLLWLRYERADKTIGELNPIDCMAYWTFLNHVPDNWISKSNTKPFNSGWAPFRGQPSMVSLQQSRAVLKTMFKWLHDVKYITDNPWLRINSKFKDDPNHSVIRTRAIKENVLDQMIAYCERCYPDPAAIRMRFILVFMSAVGLRSQEILSATIDNLIFEEDIYMLQVHGKGSRNRAVSLGNDAMSALTEYFKARGFPKIDQIPAGTPILASLKNPEAKISYPSLYENVKLWLRKSIHHCELADREKIKMLKASTHWLRHTFGTMAVSLNVPLDVIQAQMGHSSSTTTANIYSKAPIERQNYEIAKAFSRKSSAR